MEELVKRLRQLAEEQMFDFERQPYLQAADAIENISKAYQMMAEAYEAEVTKPRWIPVTERLPEKRKWVLCQCKANIIEVLRWENNEWYHDPMYVYYPSFVTHWMPLPQPPKEG